MPRGKSNQNTGILEYALRHLERERDEIQANIDHIRRQLGNRTTSTTSNRAAADEESAPAKKRTLSPAARKRIAAAQKRRWAEHRKAKAKSAE